MRLQTITLVEKRNKNTFTFFTSFTSFQKIVTIKVFPFLEANHELKTGTSFGY